MMRAEDSLFDPFARHAAGSSPGFYAPLRTADPVHWSAPVAAWVVSRYADASVVLRDPVFSSADLRPSIAVLARRAGRSFPNVDRLLAASLFFNPTDSHPVLRRFLARVLNVRPLSQLEPLIDAIASDLWQEARRQGGFDFVAAFAEVLPSRVMGHLLGIPAADLPWLSTKTRCGMAVFNRAYSLNGYAAMDTRLGEAFAFFGDLLRARITAPRDDGLTRMLRLAGVVGLDEPALVANALFLYLVGIESTAGFLSGALLTLLRHPGELARLRSRAVPVEGAVEELLRYESPVPQVMRVAQGTRDLAGRRIEAGDHIVVLVAAANGDPDVFPDPERLDLGRAGPPHLSFAEGGHSCLGAGLARLEGRRTFAELRSMPPLQIVGNSLAWWPIDAVRRLQRLDVAFA